MADPLPTNLCPGFFAVLRHGGRSGDRWRVTISSEGEARANAAFEKTYSTMRQGGVALLSPEGKRLRYHEVPLLRSRW
jgi:hypothetical protein